jgi:Zn ribbon nucleic-acid-binding protein
MNNIDKMNKIYNTITLLCPSCCESVQFNIIKDTDNIQIISCVKCTYTNKIYTNKFIEIINLY